jgi:hypothetical protein
VFGVGSGLGWLGYLPFAIAFRISFARWKATTRAGQFRSETLWSPLQAAHLIGGCLHEGPAWQLGSLHGCSLVGCGGAHTAQATWVSSLQSCVGCPYCWHRRHCVASSYG